MEGLELLERQLKEAKKVVWPNSRQDNVVKLVFELAEHIKHLYTIKEKEEVLPPMPEEQPKRGRKKKNANED